MRVLLLVTVLWGLASQLDAQSVRLARDGRCYEFAEPQYQALHDYQSFASLDDCLTEQQRVGNPAFNRVDVVLDIALLEVLAISPSGLNGAQ